MKNFQDIMKEHPSVVTQNTNVHSGSTDMLCRWYNMHWGALTDTHLQLMDDGTYVVTGSRLTKALWDNILYERRLVTAPNTILPHSWVDVLEKNGLDWSYSAQNGAFAIAIASKNPDSPVRAIEIPQTTTVITPDPCFAFNVKGRRGYGF